MEHLLYNIELLSKHHNRRSFHCGIEALNNYLQQQACQEIRKHVATTFVLTENGSLNVIGYYTLASIAIDAGELPKNIVNKLPKYPLLPATLLGRLAIDRKYQGKKLGELLIVDALQKSLKSSEKVASMAVIVEAKSYHVANFYKHYGFIQFPNYKGKLFLTMATTAELFK